MPPFPRNRQYPFVKVEIQHPQPYAFEKPKPAAVELFDDKGILLRKMFQHGVKITMRRKKRARSFRKELVDENTATSIMETGK